MTSRERTLMAIAHEQPDRPPVSATFTPEITRLLRDEYGHAEEDLGYVMGNDLIKVSVGVENSYHLSDDPEYTCPFGVRWRNASNHTGSYTEIIGGALVDDPDGDKLAGYTLPNPGNPELYKKVKEIVARYGKEKFIIGSCQCSIFETAWYLHGLEDTLMDMVANEEYVDSLFDKIMQFPLQAGLNMIECGVDMVWLGDDVAEQRQMMMSPDTWRRFLKPRYAQLISAYRAKRKDIVVAYHSCGNCEAILEDMIEIGLDVLNPIQPLAMDPYALKRKYGSRLTLFGAVDIQRLLPQGTRDEIMSTVRDYKKILGERGGYILSPAHHIQADTGLNNIRAFYDAAME